MANGQVNIYTIKPDGSGRQLLISNGDEPAFNPNGDRIAFVRGENIFLAHGDGSQQTPVTRHGLGVMVHHPSFSADGERLVFAMGAVVPQPVYNISLVNIDGSQERTVASDGRDPVYTPDGVDILFARGGAIMIMTTNNMGGHIYVPQVFIPQAQGTRASNPLFSPDSSHLLFVLGRQEGGASTTQIIAVTFADTRQQTVLVPNAGDPAYSPDGRRLAFVRNGRIYVSDANGGNYSQDHQRPG